MTLNQDFLSSYYLRFLNEFWKYSSHEFYQFQSNLHSHHVGYQEYSGTDKQLGTLYQKIKWKQTLI